VADGGAQRRIEAIFRIEYGKLVGGLMRAVRDLSLAEDLAQDALVAALEQWPARGFPDRPGAWLAAVARNRARNLERHARGIGMDGVGLERELPQTRGATDVDAALDDDIGDDLLRLIFMTCHPALAPEARVALTLRVLGGLTTEEIARAFLVSEPTVAQRVVRAKRTLAEQRARFEVPRGSERRERLATVLEVVYLVFNEGSTASSGDDWLRPALCEDALRLGRALAALAPGEPEVHGLVALMELGASRFPARTAPSGEPVLLLDQNRGRWDRLLIRRGLEALGRARALGGERGPYALQAAISACHAAAPTAQATDWARILSCYDALREVMPSPVVDLNRAVAVSMALGPEAGLALLAGLALDEPLARYPYLWSARGDMLSRLGHPAEARAAFERAAALTANERDRALLLGRASACHGPGSGEE